MEQQLSFEEKSKFDFIKELKKEKQFATFRTWYVMNFVKVESFNDFLAMPFMLRLGVYILFLETYNIQIGVGSYFYSIYYIDPNKVQSILDNKSYNSEELHITSFQDTEIGPIAYYYKQAVLAGIKQVHNILNPF
jgi:hypothetical protein